MQVIERLAELDGAFDAVLCDIWGVVHGGGQVFAPVPPLLRALREQGIPVALLSNVPRASAVMPQMLLRHGLSEDAYDAVVTSGDVTRSELARRAPGPVHRLGRENDTSLWQGLGLEFSALGPARFVAIAGLRTGEHPDDYLPALRAASVRDLELVCANPDIQVPDGDTLIWTAGSVAQRYALLGGRVIALGKPHQAIYQRARTVLEHAAGRPLDPRRILAIGDGISTDLRGANRSGLLSLLVATGLNKDSLLGASGQVDSGRVDEALTRAGATADYVMAALA